jgi:1,2-diacylglycerol 3-alpha-glucosyltransferase
MTPDVRVVIACPGLGGVHRGYESFAAELATAISPRPELATRLYGGRYGSSHGHAGRRLIALKRDGATAKWLGRLCGHDGYWIEQFSFAVSLFLATSLWRPDVIVTSDANVLTTLVRLRRLIRFRTKLLFSNGGPFTPPFYYADHVHQVSPQYLAEALAAGEALERHTLIPYGFNLASFVKSAGNRADLLESLDLGTVNRPLVLSVCALNDSHKRLFYVIDEVAALHECERPHLLLLGAVDDETPLVLARAEERLGSAGFTARTVPSDQVASYMHVADIFVLASITEGFGRVLVEATAAGLPVIAHHHETAQYVLGEDAVLADLSREGVLASELARLLRKTESNEVIGLRRQHMVDRFSWSELGRAYIEMIRNVALRL